VATINGRIDKTIADSVEQAESLRPLELNISEAVKTINQSISSSQSTLIDAIDKVSSENDEKHDHTHTLLKDGIDQGQEVLSAVYELPSHFSETFTEVHEDHQDLKLGSATVIGQVRELREVVESNMRPQQEDAITKGSHSCVMSWSSCKMQRHLRMARSKIRRSLITSLKPSLVSRRK
jgi:uncharacterized phage infection (PIP) family protein YhgE